MNVTQLVIEYCVYAAVIVIGLLILGLVKRKNKLPNHTELKTRLSNLSEQLKNYYENEKSESLNGYDSFRKISKILYALDKLVYIVSLLAEKERDMQLDAMATLLEGVRNELSPYKFSAKEKTDLSGLEAALSDMDKVLALADRILERDKTLKRRKGK